MARAALPPPGWKPDPRATFLAAGDDVLGLPEDLHPDAPDDVEEGEEPWVSMEEGPVIRALFGWGIRNAIDDCQYTGFLKRVLPPQYSPQYNRLFSIRFTAAVMEVAEQLKTEWGGPMSLAHDFAVHVIVLEAKNYAKQAGIPLPRAMEDAAANLNGDGDYEVFYWSANTKRRVRKDQEDITGWFTQYRDMPPLRELTEEERELVVKALQDMESSF